MTTLRTSPYDVVVVGARPAGAATAMLLARAGLQVLVVDRSSYGADTVSTHGLMRGGVLQLARWGLLDAGRRRRNPADAGLRVPLRRGPHRRTHQAGLRRRRPVRPAPHRARPDPRRCRPGGRYRGALRRGRRRPAPRPQRTGDRRCRAGRGRRGVRDRRPDHRGRRRVGSTVARFTGAPMERAAASAAAVIYGYWDGLTIQEYELVYRPGVAAGVFPTNGGQTCVFAGTKPRRFRIGRGGAWRPNSSPPERSRARGARGGARAPRRVRMFAGRRPGYLRQATGPGWALVGDAGYSRTRSRPTASPTPSATLNCWPVRSSPPPAGTERQSPWPPTSRQGPLSDGCSPPPTRSHPSTGTSTESRDCCWS